MENKQITYSPYIRTKDNVTKVMLDVIIALTPIVGISYLVYGITPVLVILAAVMGAVVAEVIFSTIFYKKPNSVLDLSAVVTGMLLGLTLAPFTSLYVVAFGGASAVIFGKLMYGGLGRNEFNPALVRREFMTIFFPAVMTSGAIWYNQDALRLSSVNIFGFLGNTGLATYLNNTFLNGSGAIGEYSVLLLILGGLYLLLRDRISWHIPAGMFMTVFIGMFILEFFKVDVKLSLGGLLLGGIYMATDMPTTPSTQLAKFYYGKMIGVAILLCWVHNVQFETLSYSILILNAFAKPINNLYRPKVFGTKVNWGSIILKGLGLFVGIIAAIEAVMYLHHAGYMQYVVYAYIVYMIVKFVRVKMNK